MSSTARGMPDVGREEIAKLGRSLTGSGCVWWLGQHEPSLAAGERAFEIARALADASLEAAANYHLVLTCMFRWGDRDAVRSPG